jgi:CRP/FNR family transcriptional regulator, cyclic AMP receptor protein
MRRPMTPAKKPPVDLELISSLGKRFVNLNMFSEAEELFDLALRLEPANRGLQLNLAQVRNRLKREEGDLQKTSEEAIREGIKRNAIDACHFFGLAALYEERSNPGLAAECLEIALQKEPIHPFAYKLQGKLLFRERRYDAAREAIRTAQRFNPFDRGIAELLGRIEYERESHHDAIAAFIDAFLLLRDDDHDPEENKRLKAKIRTVKAILKLSSQDVVQLFRERRIKLQTAFDRLELQRERYLQEAQAKKAAFTIQDQEEREAGRILLAARLREFEIWARLNDEHVFQLTRSAFTQIHTPGSRIFGQGEKNADFFLLEKGEVLIRRETAYGNFELARLRSGVLFGEIAFIARTPRSAEAIADTEVQLVRLDSEELDLLIDERPDLGVKIFSSFWQGLALKLRGANEQLRTFFSEDIDEERRGQKRAQIQAGRVDDVDSTQKIELLREQGLSGAELQTLADFSNVKRFPGGTFLFHEGDPGNEMYVVLEGKVMISKYIPGGGEEALAILERGDFFGEMSLIDGQPRSADAKAYQGPVTVISFDDLTLKEVQSVDPRASLDFIRLLCRLMCKRLAEIDEKVTSWRIMSGERGDVTMQLSTEFPTFGFEEEVEEEDEVTMKEMTS